MDEAIRPVTICINKENAAGQKRQRKRTFITVTHDGVKLRGPGLDSQQYWIGWNIFGEVAVMTNSTATLNSLNLPENYEDGFVNVEKRPASSHSVQQLLSL